MLTQAGFEGAELIGETGFDSSPVTRGVLVRALRPLPATERARPPVALDAFQEFFRAAYSGAVLDPRTTNLAALAAALGAACES